MTTSKMGRPLKGETKRTITMAFRVTEKEKAFADYLSERLGLSKTDTVLKALELLEKEIEKTELH